MERIAKWGNYDTPFVRRRYNRLAKFFVLFEWLFLLPRGIRSKAITISTVLFLPLCAGAQPQAKPDTWAPLKYFVGKWEGTGSGKPGLSKVQREYQFVLNGKFLRVQNRSIYDPQPKNPKGEIHDDWGMIGFDKMRKQFVFRQFHVESFVIQYVLTSVSADGKTIVFTSESIENIPAGWRSRETYKIIGGDEFLEVFELAGPGKDFEVYSEARLLRKK